MLADIGGRHSTYTPFTPHATASLFVRVVCVVLMQ